MFWLVCNYNEETNCSFDSEMNLPKSIEWLPFEVKDYEMFTYIRLRTGWESYEKLYF